MELGKVIIITHAFMGGTYAVRDGLSCGLLPRELWALKAMA